MVQIGHQSLVVASLQDVIASKEAAGRPRTGSCLIFWRKPFMKNRKPFAKREATLAAPRKESERAELDVLRRRLRLPLSKRLNYLRVRIPGGGSHL